MNPSHRAFFEGSEGRALREALTQADLLPQYELLSRLDLPAVQAAVWTVEPLLETLDPKARTFAIQASGALIGEVHARQLDLFGGPPGLRDGGALMSALDRPRNKWVHEGADLAELAAAYAFGLARNHPFIDGNKRTAFPALLGFLRLTGVRFAPDQAQATAVMLGLAAGRVDAAGLTRWIRDNWPKA